MATISSGDIPFRQSQQPGHVDQAMFMLITTRRSFSLLCSTNRYVYGFVLAYFLPRSVSAHEYDFAVLTNLFYDPRHWSSLAGHWWEIDHAIVGADARYHPNHAPASHCLYHMHLDATHTRHAADVRTWQAGRSMAARTVKHPMSHLLVLRAHLLVWYHHQAERRRSNPRAR
jgi:hypothetical protein